MSFQNVIGQTSIKYMLGNSLRNHKLSHAYIFNGPVGTGRKQMALELAKAVYCTERADDGCDRCLQCRKVDHDNHPDLHWIEPDGTNIKIDQIRELQRQFAYRSTGSHTKIVIIQQADQLNVQAANSLLKFLEDPVSELLAILITTNGHALLPTIQSRAQWLEFKPMSPSEIVEILREEGNHSPLVRLAAHITAGVPAARELARQEWFAETGNVVLQLAKEAIARYPGALLTLQQKIIKSEAANHLSVMLDLLLLWFRDMVYVRSGLEQHVVNIDEIGWMRRHASARNMSDWAECMAHILEAQKRIRFNANTQLALEKLIIDIQGG